MKNIERLLEEHSPQPRRALKKDFTKGITHYLDAYPRPSRWRSFKEILSMHYIKKPAIALLAIIVLATVSGTAYASIGGWSGIQALFGGQKKVASARVVKVDTKNCTITSAFNITSKAKQQDTYYYKVKDGSKLTNEQVVQMVRGYCELDHTGQTSLDVVSELQKNPLNTNAVVGGYIDSEIVAVSATSISIVSDIPVGANIQTVRQTFPHIDPQVIVYAGAQRLELGDLKVGDHVSLSYRAQGEALTNSETINPTSVNTEQQVVVAIAKNSADFTASINYKKYNGQEFEQVVPCKKESIGYCTVQQYHSK